MRYTRTYADSVGDSHFEDVDVSMYPIQLIPPAPPLDLAGFEAASVVSFLSAPAGWKGDPHCAPKPSIYFFLTGQYEIETSDGAKRQFRAGDVLRTDDTEGKGHSSRVVGEQRVLAGVVQLAE